MTTTQDDAETVPIGSFTTFWNWVTAQNGDTLPTHLDRSMMTGKSGTDIKVILTGLSFLGLVDPDNSNKVEPLLPELADANTEQRKQILRRLLKERYAFAFELSERNGTAQNLFELFGSTFGIVGDSRRKAATFFLHAAKHADMPVSPNFPKVRTGQGGSTTKKATKRTKKKTPTSRTKTETGGDTYTLELDSGAVVTVNIEADLMALMQHEVDRKWVMDLVDKLQAYTSSDDESDDVYADGDEELEDE